MTVADVPLPPFAYIPGQNARHPEDWFDPIKDSVQDGISMQALSETAAFKAGLVYLEQGYFWESHEVFEAVWMQTSLESVEREMLQALIQLANARLKILMERPNAARRLCQMVRMHLARIPEATMILGLDPLAILAEVAVTEREL